MNLVNLESAELIRIAIIGVILLAGLGLLRLAFKITQRILTLGCLGILIITAILTVVAMAP